MSNRLSIDLRIILKSMLNLLEDLVFLTSIKQWIHPFIQFVEKITFCPANVRITDFFPSVLKLLKIPSDLDFDKNFKYINKSSVGIKLTEIFMISWSFSLFSIRSKN